MRGRVVIFPVRGREWCFSHAINHAGAQEPSSAPQRVRDLFNTITSRRRSVPESAEIVVEFVSEKMNRAWGTLEKAPEGTLKFKLHSLGLRLLSRVKPSEVFLKSVSKDLTGVEITYPASLNPRLVRRRLRHVAMRGSIIHKKLFYGSVTLLPVTSILTVLPLPNIPFFWILFRAYSHWRALKGSERLLLLVSDCSRTWRPSSNQEMGDDPREGIDHRENARMRSPCEQLKSRINCRMELSGDVYVLDGVFPLACTAASTKFWIFIVIMVTRLAMLCIICSLNLGKFPISTVLKPSEDLDKILVEWNSFDGVKNCTISRICEEYGLDMQHAVKYMGSV